MQNTKICRECAAVKPFSDFRRNNKTPDGHAYHCRDCTNARRAAKSPKVRELLELRAQGLKRCSKCKTVQPQTEYQPDKTSAADGDGRKSICKTCGSVMTRRCREKRVLPDVASKRCRGCHEIKPIEDFTPHRYAETGKVYGYMSRCKPCMAEAARVSPAHAAYRLANADRIYRRVRKWQGENPDKVKLYARLRIHRMRAGGGESIKPADMKAIVKRQKGKCAYCRKKLTEYHIDHVVPLAKGGRHVLSNLVAACPSCNLHKSAKDPLVFMMLGQ